MDINRELDVLQLWEFYGLLGARLACCLAFASSSLAWASASLTATTCVICFCKQKRRSNVAHIRCSEHESASAKRTSPAPYVLGLYYTASRACRCVIHVHRAATYNDEVMTLTGRVFVQRRVGWAGAAPSVSRPIKFFLFENGRKHVFLSLLYYQEILLSAPSSYLGEASASVFIIRVCFQRGVIAFLGPRQIFLHLKTSSTIVGGSSPGLGGEARAACRRRIST